MLKNTDVDYVKDYQLLLTFNDGTRKLADLKPYLTGEVFGELLDLKKFTQYGLTGYTIEWANGADLAPEFLYDIGSGTLVRPNFNSAAVSISIFNAIKSAAVSRITNPDTHCGRITNAPEPGTEFLSDF